MPEPKRDKLGLTRAENLAIEALKLGATNEEIATMWAHFGLSGAPYLVEPVHDGADAQDIRSQDITGLEKPPRLIADIPDARDALAFDYTDDQGNLMPVFTDVSEPRVALGDGSAYEDFGQWTHQQAPSIPTDGNPDIWGAALRRNNFLISFFEQEFTDFEPDPNYNVLDDPQIEPYSQYVRQLVHSQSRDETRAILNQIDRENEDRQIIDEAGWTGVAFEVGATLSDPLFMATLLVPGFAIARGASVLATAGRYGILGATEATVAEGLLHPTQYTRTFEESVLNVTTSAVVSGAIGGAVQIYKNRGISRSQIEDDVADFMYSDAIEGEWIPADVNTSRDLAVRVGEFYEYGNWKQIYETPKLAPRRLRLERPQPEPEPDIPKPPPEPPPQDDNPGNVSAAKVADEILPDDYTPVLQPEYWPRFLRTPLGRNLSSPSVAVRKFGIELLSNPYLLKAHLAGKSMLEDYAPMETRMRVWKANLWNASEEIQNQYFKYRMSLGARGGHLGMVVDKATGISKDVLSMEEFNKEVTFALRRNSTSRIPQAVAAAKAVREMVFRPLGEEAVDWGIADDIMLEGDEFYVPRFYRKDLIMAETWKTPNGFRQRLRNHYRNLQYMYRKSAGLQEGEKLRKAGRYTPSDEFMDFNDDRIRKLVDGIIDNILNTPRGSYNKGIYRVIGEAMVFHERELDIDDLLIEDYLENDIQSVISRYTHSAGFHVEKAKTFGAGVDPIETITSTVRRDYEPIIDEARAKAVKQGKDPEEAAKALVEIQEKDIRDLVRTLAQLEGIHGLPDDPYHPGYRFGKALRDLNFVTDLGSITVAALPDVGRPVIVQGMGPYMRVIKQFAENPEFFKLTRNEARVMGIAMESINNQRINALRGNIDELLEQNWLEKKFETTSRLFARGTGINLWNDTFKHISSALVQDYISLSARAIRAGTADERQIKEMARLGFSWESMNKIAAQVDEFGENIDGTIVPMVSNWSNKDLRMMVQGIVATEVDNIIVTPTLAEMPQSLSHPMVKLLLQFKSFAISAHSKILAQGAGRLANGDKHMVSFFVTSMALGWATLNIKSFLSGKKLPENEWDLAYEVIDQTGMLGWINEPVQLVAKGTEGDISPSALWNEDAQELTKYRYRNLGDWAGPSAGLAVDALSMADAVRAYLKGELVEEKDVRAIRRMMPFQNVWYLRWLFNIIEDEAVEKFADGEPRYNEWGFKESD